MRINYHTLELIIPSFLKKKFHVLKKIGAERMNPLNQYDVTITRTESITVKVEATDEMFAIFLADEYVTFPEDPDSIVWNMDYDYDFKPVLLQE
jgi:urate oxidase